MTGPTGTIRIECEAKEITLTLVEGVCTECDDPDLSDAVGMTLPQLNSIFREMGVPRTVTYFDAPAAP